jgi:hypothetical protein
MHADLQAFLTAQASPFTNKTIGDWLKQSFARELLREKELMDEYRRAGREGLIAGVPAAAAKLDVDQNLGHAAPLEGDPTMLGGPEFDDVEGDPPGDGGLAEGRSGNGAAAEIAARPVERERAPDEEPDEFDDGPTEIFGEIAGKDMDQIRAALAGRPSADRSAVEGGEPAKIILSDSAAHSPVAAVAPVALSAGYPGASFAVDRDDPFLQSLQPGRPFNGYPPAGQLHGYPSADEGMFGPTAHVLSLPPPTVGVGQSRRPSLAKDIMIGVAIAAVVLCLFAAGKYLVFAEDAGPRSGNARAAASGTIALAIGGRGKATVFLDGQDQGVVDGDSLTLTVVAGDHQVRVVRDGVPPCERRISVDAKEVEVVSCPFTEPPARGQLVLDGIGDADTVFLDDEEISREAAREPIQLVPDTPHDVVVKRGDLRIFELRGIRVSSGKVMRKSIARDGARTAGDVGYLIADTTPPARVLVDGVDTGLTTPITAREKLPLSPGKHEVTFVVGSRSTRVEVNITAGKDRSVRRELPVP